MPGRLRDRRLFPLRGQAPVLRGAGTGRHALRRLQGTGVDQRVLRDRWRFMSLLAGGGGGRLFARRRRLTGQNPAGDGRSDQHQQDNRDNPLSYFHQDSELMKISKPTAVLATGDFVQCSKKWHFPATPQVLMRAVPSKGEDGRDRSMASHVRNLPCGTCRA